MMKTCKIRYNNVRLIPTILSFGILVLGLIITSGCSRNSAAVVIAGSTSVQPFAEVLAEEYMILHPGLTIDVQGGGSAAGIMAAKSNTADIGMSSRALKGDETTLWFVEIAKDGLAIVINPENPIITLTLEQVRDIYSGKVSDWSLLGGSTAKIHVFTREEGSGTRSSFESLVMAGTQIMPQSMVQDSNGAVRQLVADDRNAIGFISLGLVDETVKAVALNGVMPSREHVIDGSYTLSRPFLFLCSSAPTGLSKDFIDFTLSEKGKELLNTEGLITTGFEQ
jgi:phosphate transport system substrate-binding protein